MIPLKQLHGGQERSLWRLSEPEKGTTRILKLVHPNASVEARKGIADEFLLLERIRHPHWVRPIGFVHFADGSCGYYMEDLPGTSPLSIDAPGWAPRDLDGARAVLGALATLHAIGYVHLDLKPSQLLCVPGRGTVLIDPGLAARAGTQVAPRGTWGFIAPEVLTSGAWDRRADLYALGSILFVLWTGENLLGDGEIVEQIRRQLKRPKLHLRDRMDDLPEGLDLVVESLLDPNPNRRPRDAAQAWRGLHMMAGYRESYLERECLPTPSDLPFFPPAGVEEEWVRALQGEGIDRWAIEGPLGSGHRRLLARLRALAEVAGAQVLAERDRIIAQMPSGRHLTAQIGRGETGEHTIVLEWVGEECAAAALESYGLNPEGGEARWTHELLRLRLEERRGGESAQRRSGRERRSLAAGLGTELDPAARRRMAMVLAAESRNEIPLVGESDSRLVRSGFVRADSEGRLVPSTPPWDLDSLCALVGNAELLSAHRRFLELGGADPVTRARHALGARDVVAGHAALTEAVVTLRTRGDATGALDLLHNVVCALGVKPNNELTTLEIALVLETGAPTGLLSLLSKRDSLPGPWGEVFDAYLFLRDRKFGEAIATARAQLEAAGDPRLQMAARSTTISALLGNGNLHDAATLAVSLLRSPNCTTSLSDRVSVATQIVQRLDASDEFAPFVEEARMFLQSSLEVANPLVNRVAASALGRYAFRKGEFDSSRRLLEIAVRAAEQWGSPIARAIAQMNLAGVCFVDGRLAESEALNRAALAVCQQFERSGDAATALRNIATILDSTGRLSEALDCVRQARQMLEHTGPRRLALHALSHELTVLTSAGLHVAGRKVFQVLVEQLAEINDPLITTNLYSDLAQIERDEGRLEEARACLDHSIVIAREAGARDEVARSAFGRAMLELAGGNTDKAIPFLEEGEGVFQFAPSSEIAPLRDFTLAMSCFAKDRNVAMNEARCHVRRAAETARKSERRPWLWLCHAAEAGIAHCLSDTKGERESLGAARLALRELLDAIGTVALQESYIVRPDPRTLLAWCDGEYSAASIRHGSSNLAIFCR